MSKEIPTFTSNLDLRDLRMVALEHYRDHITDAQFKLLVVLCGLPRAGKSTLARKLGIPIVEPDAVRLAFQGRPFIPETEEWVWCMVRTMVRALFYADHNNVVTCGVFGTPSQRAQWLPNGLWFPVFVHVTTPASVCIERAKASLREDLIKHIQNLSRNWMPDYNPNQPPWVEYQP